MLRNRIIPARAGFTFAFAGSWLTSQDHPRSRGVYPASPMRTGMTLGSSPLARGLHHRGKVLHVNDWDHPRSRGVYARNGQHDLNGLGSSPLARGLRDGDVDGGVQARIIPARAGFTSSWTWSSHRTSDHPRSRGVYIWWCMLFVSMCGSSPLARGLRVLDVPVPVRAGIIPARAGFTRPHLAQAARRRDHPRSRGVYGGENVGGARVEGSSPLARGLRRRRTDALADFGIIPARAGFTA